VFVAVSPLEKTADEYSSLFLSEMRKKCQGSAEKIVIAMCGALPGRGYARRRAGWRIPEAEPDGRIPEAEPDGGIPEEASDHWTPEAGQSFHQYRSVNCTPCLKSSKKTEAA
jgi:hypothetical protein